MSSKKSQKIDKLKRLVSFPEEFLEIYENDYDTLVKEKDEEIKSLKKELKDSNHSSINMMDLFELLSCEQRYFLYNIDFG